MLFLVVRLVYQTERKLPHGATVLLHDAMGLLHDVVVLLHYAMGLLHDVVV